MAFQEGIGRDQTLSDDINRREATKDILDTLDALGLANAAKAARVARLDGLLKGTDLVTLLAPQDQAFSAISPNSLQQEEQMADLMRRHVVRGGFLAADLGRAKGLRSDQGADLQVETTGAETRINGARIVQSDIVCTNGFIHVVDALFTAGAMKQRARS